MRYLTGWIARTNIRNMFANIRATSWYSIPSELSPMNYICDTLYNMICFYSYTCYVWMKSYYSKTSLGNWWKMMVQKNIVSHTCSGMNSNNGMMDERFWNTNVGSMILGCYTDRKYLTWKNWRKINFVHPRKNTLAFERTMEKLQDQHHFEQLRNSPEKFWIFKNSTTCSISNRACGVVSDTIQKGNIPNIYMLDVHQQPELKIYIADFLWIPHESPQLICIQNKEILWHASHGNITATWIESH